MLSAGLSPLISQSVFADIGIRHNNSDYYLRFRRAAGLADSKEIQFRLTNYKNTERTSRFSGIFIGYGQQKKIDLFDFGTPEVHNYEDIFILGCEIGYAPISGTKLGVDLGFIPGSFNFNISVALN